MDRIRDLLTGICLVGAAATSVAWVLLINRGRMARAADRIAKTSRSAVAAFLFFAAIATVCAQKSGTNEPPRSGNAELRIENVELRMGNGVAAGDSTILHSPLYILHSVTTNETYSYAMPTNATRYEKWWRRGAYEDVYRLDLGDFRFPLGSYMCDYLWAYTWGMAGARLRDASNRVVATGVPMSAVPCLSQFWSATNTSGTYLLTWQDFALDRDTNELVSAQLELMASGDFIARSNLVERVYRRVNQDDWDDDGDPNDTDPNPYVYDGDNFGPHQELPQGANSNAYCWVDIVVSNANALVTFTGDGPSALPDPRFIARAGETNRVTILIGKTYQVTCPMPIVCVDQSSYEIEIYQDQDSPTEMYICWPVSIDAVSLRSGASFTMNVCPDWLGGHFAWTNSCCSVSGTGWSFTYSCGETCTCTGCAALGYYGYESYRLPASGGSCGCGSQPGEGDGGEEEDDGPYDAGASVSFTKSAVIFEDAYYNTPTSRVERQSTKTKLHCVAHGGPNGGHVRFEIVGEDKLGRVSGISLPFEGDVGAGKKIDFKIEYNGKLPSGSTNDIVVTSTFTENVQGAQPESSEAKLTSVKVELEADYVAPENASQYRHIYGVGERIKCRHQPTSVSVIWRVTSYVAENVMTDGSGCDKEITLAHLAANKPIVEVECCNAEYSPQFVLIEPTNVVAYSASWNGTCLPRGRAGGFGMKMNLYVYPMYVSFQGIDMVEVPCNDVVPPIGYYASTNFDGYLSHCSDAGAGWWHHVKAGNYWTEDAAGSGERRTPWSNGVLVWDIPIAWNYRFDDVLSWPRNHYSSTCKKIGLDSFFQQIYGIDGAGSVTIEKFDHISERNTNDVVTVDYEIVHEGNHQ